ncbi:hypothetical protein N183_02455 [Sinorhizobium sp. Sb3]|nr:hypothetical protein N183_02455 [Sinorhizobium sp. Sb3]
MALGASAHACSGEAGVATTFRRVAGLPRRPTIDDASLDPAGCKAASFRLP